MKTILSLLLLCQLLLGQSALADSLKPIDFIKDPSLLADQWQDDPIPLSSYTAEEKRLQRLINEKTATAVQTYSTAEQDKEWQQIDKAPITPTTWKILELDLTESNGKTYHTSLLRPNWWIRNIGADRNGNRFYLKIPEVVEGWAVVKEIRVNQLDTRLWNEARQGDFVYRPLTATFQHDSDTVQQLYFTGNDTPLEVTPEHPIYSIDKNDFVPAGSLNIGEQVKTRQDITTLEQRKQLAGTHRVYNLEVYRDHNFMVSLDSILVHNTKLKIGETKVINGVETTRVGRWMSPEELTQMQSGNRVVEGSGGQTFISVNGAGDFKRQAPTGSVYVEFDVPKSSLIQGGKDGWYKMLGPTSNNSQRFILNKQGGDLLPNVNNIQIIDRK